MKISFRSIRYILIVLVFWVPAHAQQTITVAAIDWCPQICHDTKQKGYILDIATEIFDQSGITLNVKIVPWSRAIEMTKSGLAYALLAPAKPEAPSLLYPEHPIGYQQICFFAHRLAAWRYETETDLAGKRIGIAHDVSVPSLESFIERYPYNFHFQPYHENFIEHNVRMVIRGRLDAFLFTRKSLFYTLQKLGFEKDIKEVGCLPQEAIYMAFSPKADKAETVVHLRAIFDKGMVRLQQTGRLGRILASYGLRP